MPRKPRAEHEEFLRKFGINVKRERDRRGYTQEQLAEMVGIGTRGIQHIEAGETNNLVTTAARIQAALQCSWEVLIPHVSITRLKPKKAPHP